MARRLLIVIVLISLLVVAGCQPKLYIYDFALEQDLNNEEGSWSITSMGEYDFAPLGFSPTSVIICSPFRYTGDFSFKMAFLLDTSTDVPSIGVLFTPTDSFTFPPTEMLMLSLNGIGDTEEKFILVEQGPGGSGGGSYDYDIPGIVRNGENILTIDKIGDTFTFKLNEEDLTEYELEYYPNRWFCINIGGNSEDLSVIIENLSIEYYGFRQEL